MGSCHGPSPDFCWPSHLLQAEVLHVLSGAFSLVAACATITSGTPTTPPSGAEPIKLTTSAGAPGAL
ncbi:hypothetical protein BRADI_3g06023v3 [Brachypodium distachyon]|uniref:Uncharacterized protein n=1 Tax=Brachypodium distachyon TaxID=15368 RepID=A0A0Q3HZS2_BRADI|nr:hypothetical protein BRADI_3g06023v3 [Brachypodium distachyon]PNT66032.1 hypothetical protein BRADI_3g06023v3 [Brachypodium distachyon]PNT66033.1 hypothetical protein BRADI_3g06023v3 [Brachypodium distachyon]